MQQLKLFQIQEPAWTEITTEWLLKYLQTQYPEMKFELFTYGEDTEIKQTFTKKSRCNFSVNKDADLTIWKNPVLIHMGVTKNYGDYSGRGQAVNSMEKFKEMLPSYIDTCKEHVKTSKKSKEVGNDK